MFLGTDMVCISQFHRQLQDKASAFAELSFTPLELRYAYQHRSGHPERHLAARYAAKEAFIKAWSASRWGMSPLLSQVDFRQIEVRNDGYGRPSLFIAEKMRHAIGDHQLQLSLSHDGDYALATVLFSQP